MRAGRAIEEKITGGERYYVFPGDIIQGQDEQ